MNTKRVSVALGVLLVCGLLEPCLSQGDHHHHHNGGYSGRRRGGRGRGLGDGLGTLLGVAAAGIGAAAITRGITGMMGGGGGFRGSFGGMGGYEPAYPYGGGGFVQGMPMVGGGGFVQGAPVVSGGNFYPASGGFAPYYPQQSMFPFQQPIAVAPAVIPSGQQSHDTGSRRILIEENFDRGQGSNQGVPIVVGQPVFG